MMKCDHCNKNITTKSPGVECSKCGKTQHARVSCSGISNKQMLALRANDNLEWTCQECRSESPKRTSIVVPEDDPASEDEDEFHDTTQVSPSINVKKFLQDITNKVQKTVKTELQEIEKSLMYCSEKVDEFVEAMAAFKEKIKDLETKNTAMINKNTHLETKLSAMEQRVCELEQDRLISQLVVIGVPHEENEDLDQVTQAIATKINTNPADVKTTKRLSGRGGKPGLLKIELTGPETRDKWVKLAREKTIIATDIIPTHSASANDPKKIYIHEAITDYHQNLLWQAKKDLHDIYKYVWCRNGRILARKMDKGRVSQIKCIADINKLLTSA